MTEPDPSDQHTRGTGRELISVTLNAEVVRALEAVTTPGNRSSFVERAIRREAACAAVGIHKDTFNQWLDERPEFAERLAAEKQRVILEALSAIKGCSTKDREFRHWSWFLETVYRDHFAPPDKASLAFTQNNFTISFEEARQIEETRAKLLPEVHAMLGLTNGQTNA
jgi:CRP-like cAMP-binding protein